MDNRGGAIGSELGAHAAPDGYTVLQVTAGTMAINPALFPKLPYAPLRDFMPVSQLATTPYILIGNTPEQFAAALKAETVKWAKVVKATGIKAD